MNVPIDATEDAAALNHRIKDSNILIAAVKRCIKKLEGKEQLSFEDQCVLTVVATATAEDLGCNATQEYFARMQENSPVNMHPIIDKFVDALPTEAQVHLMQLGAVVFGYNQDGTVDEKRVGSPERKDCQNSKTYIVRHPLSNLIKIGRSRDPEQRIRILSTQSGAILNTLLIVDEDIERELHTRFCQLRVHGEWFDDEQGLIAEYASKAKEGAA